MAVYVDDVRFPFGRMFMCHMWADSPEELLAMADIIGVQRKWIQGHPTLSFGKHRHASWVHFDICVAKKAKAIAAGAILTDRYGAVYWEKQQRLKDPALSEESRAYLLRSIERIDRLRARTGEAA